jgi:hypothetical protein
MCFNVQKQWNDSQSMSVKERARWPECKQYFDPWEEIEV